MDTIITQYGWADLDAANKRHYARKGADAPPDELVQAEVKMQEASAMYDEYSEWYAKGLVSADDYQLAFDNFLERSEQYAVQWKAYLADTRQDDVRADLEAVQ